MEMIPENAVTTMNRGFASWKFLDESTVVAAVGI